MRISLAKVAIAALIPFAVGGANAAYSLTGTANYTAGCGSGTMTVGDCGSPDTGWLSITNTGSTSFAGTATLFGVAPSQTINLSITGTLAAGQSWVFNAGPESSNQGGYNHDDPNPNLGLLFSMNGTLDGSAFANSIYDKDIHSGVFRVNPFGVNLDNYILQGGDPLGRDTTDGFEETQASGQFVWASNAPVPEPETYALMLAGLGVLGFVARRKRT